MIGVKAKRNLWRLATCLFVFCLWSPGVLQGADTAGQAQVDLKPLRVGVTADSPPLIAKQGGKIVGLEAELAREFGKYLGRDIVFVEVAWKDQIPALLDNRTDIIMSGMSMTNAREYRIAFSEPYFRTGQIALVRKESVSRVPKPGYYGILAWAPIIKIGVVKGTTGELFVTKYLSGAKKIVVFDAAKEAAAALKKGGIEGYNIDVFIHDAPMIHNLAAENEGELAALPALLTEEYLAWGIRKDDVALLESANKFIEKMNNEGKLIPIIKRWIPLI